MRNWQKSKFYTTIYSVFDSFDTLYIVQNNI